MNDGQKCFSTREKLIEAALVEFNQRGFDGTNSNKIARAAGFAPQTFYRNFKDKHAAFLAAYDVWQQEEWRDLDALLEVKASSARAVAETLLAFHVRYRVFRLSLVKLAAEQEVIAAARAKSRAIQIDKIIAGGPALGNDKAKVLAALLSTETILDGIAAGLFDGICMTAAEKLQLVISSIAPLMPMGQKP